MKPIYTILQLLVLLLFINTTRCLGQDFLWARDTSISQITTAKLIVVDHSGNSYTVLNDGYLMKLDSDGHFIWGKQLAHTIKTLSCDDTGSIFITGHFVATTDFNPDVSVNADIVPIGTNGDGYLLKLDSSGVFQWVKHFAGIASGCVPRAIELDFAGNIIINGAFTGTIDFDPGSGNNDVTAPVINVFIAKLNPQGDLIWVQNQSYSGNLVINYCLTTDPMGNIYSVAPFDTLTISRFTPSGTFVWAKRFGDEYSTNIINDIVADKDGSVYATGTFQSTGYFDFDPGPATFDILPTDFDAYVYKLDSSGDFVWAKHFTGPENQEGNAIAIDTNNSVYITGYFQISADMDPGAGVVTLATAPTIPLHLHDVFLAKLSQAGNFMSARQMGGTGFDESYGLAMDGAGSIYICGEFYGTADYDPGPAVHNLQSTSTGAYPDAFVVKLSSTSSVDVQVLEKLHPSVLIYPNPATSELTIKTEKQFNSYTITNSIGQMMMEGDMNGKESKVDIRSLATGMYYISLEGQGGSEVRKFVKM